MSLNQKLEMADLMVKQGLISEKSYQTLLLGFELIENDRLKMKINRAK